MWNTELSTKLDFTWCCRNRLMMVLKSCHVSIGRVIAVALVLAGGLGFAGRATAWGATGHRLIGVAAMSTLQAEMPDFLRTSGAATAVGELAREPDRWKGAGKVHDNERDSAHFLDLGDDGRILGGPSLSTLPSTREDYDAALRAAGVDSWKAGWLPYAIVDNWQQLAKDFADWRVDAWATKSVKDETHRAWFAADLAERQALILRDIGALGHYVGDGSQPLHVSIHYNGWGDGPNPEQFTQSRLHAMFEGAFVHDNVNQSDVTAAVGPFTDCRCAIAARVANYLATTNAEVAPLYRLQKAEAFTAGDPRGKAFAAARLAAGATELRDLIVQAWRASLDEPVLDAAGVVDRPAGQVIVRNPPDFLAARVHLDHQVSQGAADEGVAVGQADRGERHVGRLDLADDLALGRVFADDLVEQLRDEVVPTRQLAGHPGLEVRVAGLRLDRHLDDHPAARVDLDQPRLLARLGDEDVAVVQLLRSVDLGLSPSVGPQGLALLVDQRGPSAGHVGRLVEGEEDRPVGQDPAVARGAGVSPGDGPDGVVVDVGLHPASEEAVGHLRRVGGDGRVAGDRDGE